METEDINKVYEDLSERKSLPFWHFMLGYEGGLDPETLQSAGIDFVDIKYKMLEKGTKVYTLNPGKREPILVFSLNLETLQTILAKSSPNGEETSDGVACVGVYELTSDKIVTMQIREDVAVELCILWTKSKNKDEVQEETDARDYRKLLQSRNSNLKIFLDLCFETKNYCPENIDAVVYTRQSSTYRVLVTGDDFITNRRMVQNVVLPKSSISKLKVDQEGYLRLGATVRERTDFTVDSVYAEVKENEVFEQKSNAAEVVPSYDDNLPTAEEYNDYKAGDQSLDYEAIDIRPLPQTSPVSSPRPDQPPPAPPGAEPVYGIIDKSTKKPKGRSKSVDQPDTPGTPTGNKPPRPPPLDTMPNSDGESPAQSTLTHKPSRPSAPPRIQRGKMQSMDAGMGSSGNVSLDGKDDSVVAPPRSSVKAKGHQKSETSTRF